jgi:serine O-acetyltransferase
MWNRGRKALAVALQSRMSEVFGVDIHPAAQIGWGVMMDHATGELPGSFVPGLVQACAAVP